MHCNAKQKRCFSIHIMCLESSSSHKLWCTTLVLIWMWESVDLSSMHWILKQQPFNSTWDFGCNFVSNVIDFTVWYNFKSLTCLWLNTKVIWIFKSSDFFNKSQRLFEVLPSQEAYFFYQKLTSSRKEEITTRNKRLLSSVEWIRFLQLYLLSTFIFLLWR